MADVWFQRIPEPKVALALDIDQDWPLLGRIQRVATDISAAVIPSIEGSTEGLVPRTRGEWHKVIAHLAAAQRQLDEARDLAETLLIPVMADIDGPF